MKNVIFCDMSPFGSFRKPRFGGTYRLHLQGEKQRTKNTLAVGINRSTLRRFLQEPHAVRSHKTALLPL
jgi:hypothetical protein